MPGMNLTYVATVPATNDDPSIDQPNMLINTGSINSWVSQDHYGFNTSGQTNNFGGLHAQVTFAANNVPGGYTFPTLYTNVDAFSNPQLFLATTSAANSTNQYVAASSGSVLLMGGIILKWGVATVNGTGTVSFPVAFPNNCFNVQATIDRTGAGVTVSTNGPNKNNFVAYVATASSPISATFFYLAVGN